MSQSPIKVVGAVFIRGDEVLACRKAPGKSLAGFWEFPGGKIEPGESPEEALARELTEELHIDATVGNHITTTVHEYEFATIELATYQCTTEAAQFPHLTDHDQVRWIHRSQLSELEWAPADVPTVALLSPQG